MLFEVLKNMRKLISNVCGRNVNKKKSGGSEGYISTKTGRSYNSRKQFGIFKHKIFIHFL